MEGQELFQANKTAYNMVFKSLVEISSLKAAWELGLFEALADGPRDLITLAEQLHAVPARLEKFLIALQQMNLVIWQQDQWELTPFAIQFFTRAEAHRNLTMVPFVDYLTSLLDSFYLHLADVVRGQLDFTSLIPHPPRTREDSLFYETLHRSNIFFPAKLLCERGLLADRQHLVDVGGGIGDIAALLCEHYPQLHVTLINVPSAIELVQENMAARGLNDRIQPTVLDMYHEPYPSSDALLFGRILYPMNPQFSAMMLQKAYDSLLPGGRVLILDMIICDPQQPNYDYLSHYLCAIGMDFSMLEFKSHRIYPELLKQIGFQEIRYDEDYEYVLYQAVKPMSENGSRQ
ncbi:MAG: C-20 methyltransferase BchU [Chloroflexaceae bacterium]|nr:C-20 methyltransferase BchU [Chloroflexaceae bacterium]